MAILNITGSGADSAQKEIRDQGRAFQEAAHKAQQGSQSGQSSQQGSKPAEAADDAASAYQAIMGRSESTFSRK